MTGCRTKRHHDTMQQKGDHTFASAGPGRSPAAHGAARNPAIVSAPSSGSPCAPARPRIVSHGPESLGETEHAQLPSRNGLMRLAHAAQASRSRCIGSRAQREGWRALEGTLRKRCSLRQPQTYPPLIHPADGTKVTTAEVHPTLMARSPQITANKTWLIGARPQAQTFAPHPRTLHLADSGVCRLTPCPWAFRGFERAFVIPVGQKRPFVNLSTNVVGRVATRANSATRSVSDSLALAQATRRLPASPPDDAESRAEPSPEARELAATTARVAGSSARIPPPEPATRTAATAVRVGAVRGRSALPCAW